MDVYPDHDKYSKQFKYAESRNIPVVVMMGADESAANEVTVKNLTTGTQVSVPRNQAALTIRELSSPG